MAKNLAPFKVGDKVRNKFRPETVLTVLWVCKGNYDRADQLIATEVNDYFNTNSDASLYMEAVQ